MQNGTIILSRIKQFSNINKDTIWGVGSSVFFGAGRFRGLIYKSTNGGETWGYQLPDTSIDISIYPYVVFTDSRNGWAYNVGTGIHTKTSGNDTTYFVGIRQVPNYIPEKFTLAQNFPNPFNPSTSISFELKEVSHVTLGIYDIRGVMIKELVNGGWSASKYIVEFDGTDQSSGVYFYRIEIKGVGTNEKFKETKRMMLIK